MSVQASDRLKKLAEAEGFMLTPIFDPLVFTAPDSGYTPKEVPIEPKGSSVFPEFMRPERAPDMVIGPPEAPYLLRWYIIPRNQTFNVYYHRMLRDDDDRALHDHPWSSFSTVTRGQIIETTKEGKRLLQKGDCIYRGPEFLHRLELVDGEPAETLFITGPREREWGFDCPKGWVHWQDFVNPESPGQIGRGCGEFA